jgi:hypothetical protein
VSNNVIIKETTEVKDAFLRESLAILVRNHGPEDIVQILSEVMDDYAVRYACQTGDYDGASALKLIAAHLAGLDHFIENYDPTVQ